MRDIWEWMNLHCYSELKQQYLLISAMAILNGKILAADFFFSSLMH